jgi:16S rRNA (guanine527-N7)-methyltransferase
VSFAEELQSFLPADVPHRDELIAKGARHLDLIVEANRQFNLTRILDPREAAIKHTVDSIIPWRHFQKARTVVDAGTGAGFPGIPLAIALPETRFILLESIQKKARFTTAAAAELGLSNVEVRAERAEDWLKQNPRPDVVTARAVAPLIKALPLFAHALKKGCQVLMYKGPDVEAEIHELPARDRARVRILERYELPESMGSRTLISLSS